MFSRLTFSLFFILFFCVCAAYAHGGDACVTCQTKSSTVLFSTEAKWAKVYNVFSRGGDAQGFISGCMSTFTAADEYRDGQFRAIGSLIALAKERGNLWSEVAWSVGNFLIVYKGGSYGDFCPW